MYPCKQMRMFLKRQIIQNAVVSANPRTNLLLETADSTLLGFSLLFCPSHAELILFCRPYEWKLPATEVHDVKIKSQNQRLQELAFRKFRMLQDTV
ncbi:hypothetical protein HMPREF1870_00395 [Bacteroidales bacterium KA00344]|nr:hypothetical protein HMPREF1870_00395 [Bacteroidales bacterium KA00344]